MTIKKGHSYGDIEKQFKDEMGIGVQIMLPHGKEFAPNKIKLLLYLLSFFRKLLKQSVGGIHNSSLSVDSIVSNVVAVAMHYVPVN